MRILSLLIILFFLALRLAHSQTPTINEVMASNSNVISDEDGSYEDWIELFNPGTDSFQLEGYGLSDDYDRPFKICSFYDFKVVY